MTDNTRDPTMNIKTATIATTYAALFLDMGNPCVTVHVVAE